MSQNVLADTLPHMVSFGDTVEILAHQSVMYYLNGFKNNFLAGVSRIVAFIVKNIEKKFCFHV